MNKNYKLSVKTGARVRVLATGELGTIAEKMLIRRNGRVKTYCNIHLDKNPKQDTWYFADKLGSTKEFAFITFCDNSDNKIIVGVEFDHEHACISQMKVAGVPDDPDQHQGFYKLLAATVIQSLQKCRPCTTEDQ